MSDTKWMKRTVNKMIEIIERSSSRDVINKMIAYYQDELNDYIPQDLLTGDSNRGIDAIYILDGTFGFCRGSNDDDIDEVHVDMNHGFVLVDGSYDNSYFFDEDEEEKK